MRTALPRSGLLPSGTPSCTCARQASHFPASLSTASSPPPPPPAPSTSLYAQPATPALAQALDNPAWSDPAYLRRYRDPSRHDARLPPSTSRRLETSAKSSAASSSTSDASSANGNGNGNGNGVKTQRSRRNRLEMEALWSGGDFSPPIPLESYRAQTTRPRHALLFPGSGSQYVGMGAFLREQKPAQDVWTEAEEALAGFEDWRKGLKLHEHEGELGQLGRMLDETEAARRKEPKLREVVFEGPQVRLVPPHCRESRLGVLRAAAHSLAPLAAPQDELTRSSNAQPAILVTSTAFLRTLEVSGSLLTRSAHADTDPDVSLSEQRQYNLPLSKTSSLILGHSSGEYSAAVATGALSLTDGVRLTRLHGLLTHYALSLPSIGLSPDLDAPPALRGQMSALVLNPGHSHAELTEVIAKIRAERQNLSGSEGTVEVASFNSTTQVVLAGSRDGILRASEVLKELEIASRAADLPVSSVAHSSTYSSSAQALTLFRSNQRAFPLLVHGARRRRHARGAHFALDHAPHALDAARLGPRRLAHHDPVFARLGPRGADLAPRALVELPLCPPDDARRPPVDLPRAGPGPRQPCEEGRQAEEGGRGRCRGRRRGRGRGRRDGGAQRRDGEGHGALEGDVGGGGRRVSGRVAIR